VVAIKSSYSKERLLGLRDGIKLGFWRHVVGQGEKWVVLKANYPANAAGSAASSAASAGGIVPSSQLGMEDITARGKYVRIGDSILIQTYKSDHCLSLVDAATSAVNSSAPGAAGGSELRLVLKDRAGLGLEAWQLEAFGTVPLPTWYQTRPYLSGRFLVLPPTMRAPAPEIEGRVFPRASHVSSFMQSLHSNLHPLNDYEPDEQHRILMREILLLLSGIEGNYIRVAAAVKSFASQPQVQAQARHGDGLDDLAPGLKSLQSNLQGRLLSAPALILPAVEQIKLVIDLDSADRSSATQVTQLLTMCEQTIKIRHFIATQSRYEFGYISHAFCAAVKSIVHDLDVLICQLEFLLNQDKLSLQKFIFLLQQSKTTITILDRILAAVRDRHGGQLLNELHAFYLQQGDEKYSKKIYEFLLEKSFVPFLKILSTWIFR
jgi:hypothetical protein